MSANLENSAVATGLEKVSFDSMQSNGPQAKPSACTQTAISEMSQTPLESSSLSVSDSKDASDHNNRQCLCAVSVYTKDLPRNPQTW